MDTTRLHRRRREAWPVLGMTLLDAEVRGAPGSPGSFSNTASCQRPIAEVAGPQSALSWLAVRGQDGRELGDRRRTRQPGWRRVDPAGQRRCGPGDGERVDPIELECRRASAAQALRILESLESSQVNLDVGPDPHGGDTDVRQSFNQTGLGTFTR